MSTILDLAIGLAFIYLLLALVVTAIQELFATISGMRANDLYQTIADMLATRNDAGELLDKELLTAFYAHPFIKNLRQRKSRKSDLKLPSYIPSRTFAIALLDVLRHSKKAAEATGVRGLLDGAREKIGTLGDTDLAKTLRLLSENAELLANSTDKQVEQFVTGIEGWFNDRMARASGWYKRRAQAIALVLAGVLSVVANADSIHVATVLWSNGTLRDSIVVEAEAFVAAQLASAPPTAAITADEKGEQLAKKVDDLSKKIDNLKVSSFPIGWGAPINAWTPLGWLLTALSASLGAGFWFDALSKVLQLRGTGPKISAATGRTSDSAS
jgi:hypothetical protein